MTASPALGIKARRQIIESLTEQGGHVEGRGADIIKVTAADGSAVVVNLGGSNQRSVLNVRTRIKKLGFYWPLDEDGYREEKIPQTEKEPTPAEIELVRVRAERSEARLKEAEKAEKVSIDRKLPPAATGITHLVENIGPDEAEAILETNTRNRRLSQLVVTKLADQMTANEWNYDAAPIRISDKGDLLDGQHRLWAIIESGTTQKFLVVRGVTEDAMTTMDTGKSRSFADILSMHDATLTSVSHIAAVTAIMYRWAAGVRNWEIRANGTTFTPYGELLEYFKENREIILESARKGVSFAHGTGATPSVLALVWRVLHEIDTEDADYFFDRLRDGASLEPGDPILTLREWLRKSASFRPRTPNDMAIALILKAWNAYRSGSRMQILVWKRGGATPENFPIPQ